MVFTWSFLPLPGSEFRSPIISQNCFSSSPTWPFYSTINQQPTFFGMRDDCGLECVRVVRRVINYILKSLNRFASFDGSMHSSEVQHSRWWVPNSTSAAKAFRNENEKTLGVCQCQNQTCFLFHRVSISNIMWNIQSPKNISSEHICVFALLMMFRQKFWDQGHTHQESVMVSKAQKSK